MSEEEYDRQIALLGQLRNRLQQLEDSDYITAYYKGYSSDGQTVNEIEDEIQELNIQIDQLTQSIDEACD